MKGYPERVFLLLSLCLHTYNEKYEFPKHENERSFKYLIKNIIKKVTDSKVSWSKMELKICIFGENWQPEIFLIKKMICLNALMSTVTG